MDYLIAIAQIDFLSWPWYSIFTDMLIPIFSPFIATFGALWVGIRLGYINKKLTIETNQEILETQRIEDLEEMQLLSKIEEIVQRNCKELKNNLEDQIGGLREHTDKQIGGLREDMNKGFIAVRGEMKQEFADVRGEMKQEFTAVRGEIKELAK
jgi:hypothetical protein